MQEECGITAPLEHAGSLLFILKNGPEWAFQIELYRADTYTGTIVETDEMRPEWFSASDLPIQVGKDVLPSIPFDNMWPDDVYWMPHLLSQKRFSGRADFETDANGNSTMRRWWFGVNNAQ
ncbi:hypothetical protein OF83DRAFT_1089969 [Amylostereum chailletii]|nr:hypothetical protein OF83DRAFT_1089969 [Amylostereum chailletii]